MILRELVGDRANIHVLLQPGASPHMYEPRPSDARFAEDSLATFYFDHTVDGWAAKLGGDKALAIAATDHSQASDHDHANPHVWLDPVAVRACIPQLLDALVKLDPDGELTYRANGKRFMDQLAQLNDEVRSMLTSIQGRSIIQAHASWDLFFERYGIRVAGTLESTPGASQPPPEFAEIFDAVSRGDVFAVIAEPQLPREPLETLAANKVPIVELDPLGGGAGMSSYAALIRTNAQRLADAAQ